MIPQGDSEIRVDWFTKFRFPHKRAVTRWLLLTLQLFIVVTLTIGVFHIKTLKKYVFWKHEMTRSQEDLARLQKKIGTIIDKREGNQKLRQEWGVVAQQQQKHETVLYFMRDLSQAIPPGTWLERFSIIDQEPHRVVVIEGRTKEHREIAVFYSNLSKLQDLDSCNLKYLQKASGFKFKITANLCEKVLQNS